jgi:transposase
MTTVAKKLAQVKPGTLFAGLDLGLDSIAVAVLTDSGQRVDRFKVTASRDGYQALQERLQRVVTRQMASGVLLGLEPTNYYWKLVGTYLNQVALPFRLVNPYTVKRHREGDHLDRAKDDWRDAATIADLLRTGKFTETRLRTGGYAELQVGHAAYWRLRHDRGRQVTLLTNSLRQVFPEMSQVFKDLTCHTAHAVLQSLPAAAAIRTLSWPDFLAQVRVAAAGQRLAVSKLRQLYSLAATSIGVLDGLEALQFDVRTHLTTLTLLDHQAHDLLALLLRDFRALPEAPYLCSIEALSELFALGILAETGPLDDYGSGKDLIKLAGTQPTPNASGRYERQHTPFSKQGRGRLRFVLFWATLPLLKHNAAIAHQYHRLQTRAPHPLTKMEAIGACMNKLLWYVWHTGHAREKYDPDFWKQARCALN